ncbi:MAG: hypothetical protein ACRD37_00500 [Candidatus Acidiferrales bacterium]
MTTISKLMVIIALKNIFVSLIAPGAFLQSLYPQTNEKIPIGIMTAKMTREPGVTPVVLKADAGP